MIVHGNSLKRKAAAAAVPLMESNFGYTEAEELDSERRKEGQGAGKKMLHKVSLSPLKILAQFSRRNY